MRDVYDDEGKVPENKQTPLFVCATIAIIIVAMCSWFIWTINFQEIIEVGQSGDANDAIGAAIATFVVFVPFFGAAVLTVILSLIFSPLTLVKLRKSSDTTVGTVGLIYGIAFIILGLAAIGRFILFLLDVM